MDVSLTTDESAAIRKALRSYLSDLRAEIVDTDNPEYKRELREERAALEGALGKLDQLASPAGADEGRMTVIGLWWTAQ